MKDLLIYGCNGYTGQLISELAAQKGIQAILAGRSDMAVAAVADRVKLPYTVFDLNDDEKLHAELRDVKMVLHCAGPFQHTAQPMAHACIATATHYVDITGEIQVFEYLKACDKKAAMEGIMLLPGGGFDVVPSDCLASWLHGQMPDATKLTLALYSPGGSMSHGTATTVVENIGSGGAIRENGTIKNVRHGYHSRDFDFGFAVRSGITIPWGDLSTAYTSTGIPNIRVYNCVPPVVQRGIKMANYTGWLLSTAPVQRILKSRLKKRPAGPAEEQRATTKSYILGEIENGDDKIRGLLEMPDGYSLTAATAIKIAEKIIKGEFKPGYQTPSGAYGAELIMEIENVVRKKL